MNPGIQNSRVLQAVEALKTGDRRAAVNLLKSELQSGPQSGDRWQSVSRLAFDIGAIDIGLEASRRFAATSPVTLERMLHYWGDLANYGRTNVASAAVAKLPVAGRQNPTIAHFLGTIAGQEGDFVTAERHFRAALAKTPELPQTWFALAMIKTFAVGDNDLAAMEHLRGRLSNVPPAIYARFLYALAKAKHDTGDIDGAFALYSQGAQLRQKDAVYNRDAIEKFADRLCGDFTSESIAKLRPSANKGRKSIFVNGLPRSGTTLVEQILASHSQVVDGAEINLFRAALIPTRDYSFAGAVAYQRRVGEGSDPWGAIARDYHEMLALRFQTTGLIVDKTLSQSHFMGLIMHALPSAKVIWMRRKPEDTALSCYRSFFSSAIPWSWSLTDTAHYFRVEDRLYDHWSGLFPDRILTVPYEELVREPTVWIPKILAHAELDEEPQVYAFHETKRSVRTASVQQVRGPISTNRIDSAKNYERHLAPFLDAYYA
jgi:tetratricopeptide (TPR) repeat protein